MGTVFRAVNGRVVRANGRRATGPGLTTGAVFVAPADGSWQYLTTTQVGMSRNQYWELHLSPALYARDGEGSYCYTGNPNTGGTAVNEYSVQATQVYFDIPSGFGLSGVFEVFIVLVSTQQVVFSQLISQANKPDNPAGESFASPVLPEAHYLVRVAWVSGVAAYDGIGIRR
jgi:hypothetical protein